MLFIQAIKHAIKRVFIAIQVKPTCLKAGVFYKSNETSIKHVLIRHAMFFTALLQGLRKMKKNVK